ncbi:protein indeterminate-domain 11-like [Iris pallida]|uniref:Protein EARLY HEADING DATE 2 n=1 Tax=Iris pallida TaxID=29817 RepID=A0AAX6EM19_IRIPA|nr:protein indeterminate-domain 11-like [Iris pallida]
MKGLVIIPSYQVQEENMSNLTSASGGDQASVSNSSQQHSSFASPNPSPAPAKRKRNLPGNPDPEAEVVALSPRSLMATNRFVCEICNKGFQRDQNLQLHRRGHNLPWKLKQRSGKEARKKVYVCPEASCVHHDAARALGDLTGIKKHFSRKHGEKKWKCDKCSKKYAVQSDWKAHSKICGTREYRCDCGTLFSRRDSFITHRAFCDALAEESRRAITGSPMAGHHPLLFAQPMSSTTAEAVSALDPLSFAAPLGHFPHPLSFKRENLQQQQELINMRPDIPPWLACHQQQLPTSLENQQLTQDYSYDDGQNPCVAAAAAAQSTTAPYQAPAPAAAPSAYMSATALLQKAAQMGATMSKPPHHGQMATALHSTAANSSSSSAFGLGSCSYQDMGGGGGSFVHQDMMLSPLSAAAAASGFFDGPSFREAFGGMPKREGRGHENGGKEDRVIGSVSHGGGNDGMTRDFLGLQRPFSQRDILSMAGLDHHGSSSSYEQQPPHKKQRS